MGHAVLQIGKEFHTIFGPPNRKVKPRKPRGKTAKKGELVHNSFLTPISYFLPFSLLLPPNTLNSTPHPTPSPKTSPPAVLPRGFRGPKIVEVLYAKIGIRLVPVYRQF